MPDENTVDVPPGGESIPPKNERNMEKEKPLLGPGNPNTPRGKEGQAPKNIDVVHEPGWPVSSADYLKVENKFIEGLREDLKKSQSSSRGRKEEKPAEETREEPAPRGEEPVGSKTKPKEEEGKTNGGFWSRTGNWIDKATKWADTHGKELLIGFGVAEEISDKIREFRGSTKQRADANNARKEARRTEQQRKDQEKQEKKERKSWEEKEPPDKVSQSEDLTTEVEIRKEQREAAREKEREERAVALAGKQALKEPEIIPESKEIYSNLRYEDLRIKLKHEEDPAKRNKIREEKFTRALEVIDKTFYDLSQEALEKRITETLGANDLDTFDESLRTLADIAEGEAGSNNEYKGDKRLTGSVYDIVRGEVDAVRLSIYLGLSDTELDARNLSRKELERERDKLESTRLGLTTVRQPAGYLQAEPTEELLNEYASHNIPGAERRLRRMQKEEQLKKEETERRKVAQPAGGETTANSVEEGMKRLRLSEKQEIEDFIARERWNDNVYEFDKKENLYYKDLEKTKDRQIFEWRVWLHWAMATRQSPDRSTGSWGAETFANNSAMKRIPQEALEALTNKNNFPGVIEVIQEYQRLVEENNIPSKDTISTEFESPKGYYQDDEGNVQERPLTLMNCVLRDDIDVYRKMVEQKVYDKRLSTYQQKGMVKEEADQKARLEARNAEQIGWNIWVVQGGFERESIWEGRNKKTGKTEKLTDSSDSRLYSEITRVRGPKISQSSTDMMHKPVRTFLNPMDALIDMATRKGAEDKEQKVGGLYDWAARNIRRSLTEAGVSNLDEFSNNGGFDKVVIIDDNDEKNYWRVVNNNGKYTLYLPQFIPVRTMGSYFEHTKTLDPERNFEERKLIEIIREGREIPWEYTKGGFSSYLVDTSYWVNIWDTLSYETSKKGGEDEDLVLDMLGSVDRREDESLFRWIRYYHQGVVSDKKLPTMTVTPGDRQAYELLRKQYKNEGVKDDENMYTKEKIYFKSDRKVPFRQRIRRWWRRTFW